MSILCVSLLFLQIIASFSSSPDIELKELSDLTLLLPRYFDPLYYQDSDLNGTYFQYCHESGAFFQSNFSYKGKIEISNCPFSAFIFLSYFSANPFFPFFPLYTQLGETGLCFLLLLIWRRVWANKIFIGFNGLQNSFQVCIRKNSCWNYSQSIQALIKSNNRNLQYK